MYQYTLNDIIEPMKKLLRKIFKKKENPTSRQKDIKQTTNAVFEEYKTTFKDLARYDRGEKISTN